MASIYPHTPDIPADHPEHIVFTSLRDGLPDDWLVIHGRRFVLPQGNRRPAEGEVDFLVLDPKRGIVALEVKGGHVGRDHDGWYRNAPSGRKRIKDPGLQAQNAIHNLGHYIRDGDPALSRLGWGWGVVLPDVDVDGDLGADLPRRLVTDRGDLSDPTAAVGRAFDHFNVDGPALDDTGVSAFRNVVLPRFRLVPSMKPVRIGPKTLAERIAADEAELVRLTEDQMRVLDFNGHATRLAIEGGAGTGKTLVAVEQARRLAAAGDRVLVLCFNRGLAEGLADDLRDIEAIDVFSFHGMCHARAIAAGLAWPSKGDADFWEMEAPELLLQALGANPGDRYDAVLVDEAQDFADHWWIPVQALMRDPDGGTLWVFHDPPQNIFGREGWSELAAMPSARLSANCRNTVHIGEHAYGALDIDAQFLPGAPQGSEVSAIECADERAMVEGVRKTIHRLVVEEKIDPVGLVVLSARAEYASAVWQQRTFGNFELVAFPATGPGQIGFATLQRFKDLEADAVILCEVTPGEPHSTPNHVYVGASRAKHALVVLQYRGPGMAKASDVSGAASASL